MAVEHIVYKEVQVPIEVGVRQETRIGDTRTGTYLQVSLSDNYVEHAMLMQRVTVVGTEIRRSTNMTTEHNRADISDLRSYVASGGRVELNGNFGEEHGVKNEASSRKASDA